MISREQNRVAELLGPEGQKLKDYKFFEERTVPPMFVLKTDNKETSFAGLSQPYFLITKRSYLLIFLL